MFNVLHKYFRVLHFYVYWPTYFHLKVLAEQQAGRKAAASENERDRSPIRGNRAPLLPDPVPGSFAQIRPKRRALLPTPPGGPEEPPAATNAPEGSDPVARYTYHMCYRMEADEKINIKALFARDL